MVNFQCASTQGKYIRRVAKVEDQNISLVVDNTAWADSDKGQLPKEYVVGRVSYIWFSTDTSRIGSNVK